MSEKNQKIFMRILIGTAIVLVLGIAADFLFSWIYDSLHSAEANYIPGHGGGSILFGVPAGILVLLVSYIILLVKTKKEK